MTQPRAGWYPDPSDPSRQRYFDGNAWTENYAPFPAPPPGVGQSAKPAKQSGINKRWLFGVGVTAVVVIAIASGGNDSDNKSTASSPPSIKSYATQSAEPSGPSVAPAGSSVRDGKFEFQVIGVERSPSKAGIFNPEQAKGEFFVVNLRVTNIGNEQRTFWASNQKLIINGNKYEASSSLSDDSFRQDINPGLNVNAKVEFDIPPGAVPDAIVCRGHALSRKTRVYQGI